MTDLRGINMTDLIGWLNGNQGFVMGLLTLVYVLATLIMVILMMRSNQITREIEKERSRPMVIFDLELRHLCIHTILKNVGLTPAYNVKVSASPSITTEIQGKQRESTLTEHNISLLAPNRELSDFVESNIEFYKRYPNPIFKGFVEYENKNRKPYKEDFIIDLNFQKEHMYVKEKDIGNELEKISKAIEKIISSHFIPLIRTIEEKEYQEEKERELEASRKQIDELKKKMTKK